MRVLAGIGVALSAALIAASAAADGGSQRYWRAVNCAANATFAAHRLRDNVKLYDSAREFETASNHWRELAQSLGEFDQTTVSNNIYGRAGQMDTEFFAGNDRKMYLQGVLSVLEDCKANPPL